MRAMRFSQNKDDLRASLIQGLQDEMDKDSLPSVRNVNSSCYLREATNSLICVGGVSTEVADMIEAVNYFDAVCNKLSASTALSDKNKVKYCSIASNAIKQIIESADR